MRGARRAAASWRVVTALVACIAVVGGGAWWLAHLRESLRNEPAPALPAVPEPAAPVELVDVKAPPRPVEPSQDALEVAWIRHGAEAVVQESEGMRPAEAAASVATMRRALLRAEALLALGRIESAIELNRALCEALSTPTPAQACEPLALEQHARVRMAAGEMNLLKHEDRLRACIEGRALSGGDVPSEAWATLGTLQKARGECAVAVQSYAKAVSSLDAPAWLRLRQREPWRLQLLALVAMDRADCLATIGQLREAREAATRLTADLATALGEGDPIVQQAADLRDQLQSDR